MNSEKSLNGLLNNLPNVEKNKKVNNTMMDVYDGYLKNGTYIQRED